MNRLTAVVMGLVLTVGPARAQDRPSLRVTDDRTERLVSLETSQGWLALDVSELISLGWSVEHQPMGADLTGPQGTPVRLWSGSPFFLWDGAPLQLADAPYQEGGRLLIPLQFVADVLPWRMPERYAFDGPTHTLRVSGVEAPLPRERTPAVPVPAAVEPEAPEPEAVEPDTGQRAVPTHAAPVHDTRMVILDAGHGGADPGSISKSGVREKTVALGVALAAAKALEGHSGLDVRLLRDDDTFVPLWDRGAIATEMKGDVPGVFVSIHANSFTTSARGFETYFLSDARTEHERRVAAIENAPIALEDGSEPAGGDLDFILRELKNLDTSHWSSLLAELVQGEIAKVHPGPNRGVKQAPLAVITNALMPSVLVEVGYLSHPQEARLLAQADFQEQMGQAIAEAVLRFFERYPPGAGGGVGEGR